MLRIFPPTSAPLDGLHTVIYPQREGPPIGLALELGAKPSVKVAMTADERSVVLSILASIALVRAERGGDGLCSRKRARDPAVRASSPRASSWISSFEIKMTAHWQWILWL